MTKHNFYADIETSLKGIKADGLYKSERLITGPQSSKIDVGGTEVLNFCANNYLGLADSPELIKAGLDAQDEFGFGMASVRFICGTQTLHRRLEEALTEFLGTEETILYPSCFDANGGLLQVYWPARDGTDIMRSRRLNILRSIFSNRLTDVIREEESAAYSPSAGRSGSRDYPGYGYMMASLGITPEKAPDMIKVLDRIAADFQAGNISDDEFDRAIQPVLLQ